MESPKSPLWYIKSAWLDWPRALREPQGVRKLTLTASGALIVILTAASRQTAGWIHLLWALALFSAFLAFGLTGGAMLAARRARRPSTESYARIVVAFLLVIVFGVWPLPAALVGLAGIPMAIATRMLTGITIGIATFLTITVLWIRIGHRAPNHVYVPKNLPRWWFRFSMWASGVIGAAIALDPTSVPRLIGQLFKALTEI